MKQIQKWQMGGVVLALSSAVLASGGVMLNGSAWAATPDPYLTPAKAPEPADNKATPARIELGKALFFDPRMSGSNWISCATCHNPALGWSDGLPTGIGHGMGQLKRASPSIINTGFSSILMWDGRAKTLEEQALGPIQAGVEMAQPLDMLLPKLNAIKGYREMFEKAYPGEGITGATIGKAIAAFERTIISTDSPFDKWRRGDKKAVSESAQRGFALFITKANCTKCHSGYNFTDDSFHNLGIQPLSGEDDPGRYAQRKVNAMKGAFKTPTLRDIALTAPYMHNGVYKTLEEVVDHYDRGGDVKDNLSPDMKPLGLTAQEKTDLVEFMKTLTGKRMDITVPRLPH